MVVHKHFVSSSLSRRIDFALDLTSCLNTKEETKTDFCQSLKDAKSLLKYRNLVAHNPLCLVINQGEFEPPFTEAIAHCTKDDFIDYDCLVNIAEKSQDVAEQLSHNFSAFRVEKINFDSLHDFPGLKNKSQGKPAKVQP